MKLRADLILKTMATTFVAKNKQYADNWEKVAKVFVALFPDGITLKTEEDFARFHFLDWTVGKFTRFVNTGLTDTESVHDGAVYMAMLEALIKLQKENDDVRKINERNSIRKNSKGRARPQGVVSSRKGDHDR